MNSTQFSLFDWLGDLVTKPEAKKTNVRTTSRKVYREIKQAGTLGKQSQDILAALKPGLDYSLQEISRLTGIPINAVSGRVNSMKRSDSLMECDKRPCRITGRTIIPVKLHP